MAVECGSAVLGSMIRNILSDQTRNSLNSWTLVFLPMTEPTIFIPRTFGNGVAVPIIDPAVVSSTLPVAGMQSLLTSVELGMNVTHTFAGDLDITLMSPSGTVATVTTANGGSNDDVYAGTYFSEFADQNRQVPYASNNGMTTDNVYVNLVVATPLTPEESLGTFKAENPNGVWTLTISDDEGGDVGTLNSWALTITTHTCRPNCPGDINGDGVTNIDDFLGVIGFWGACP